MKKNKNVGLMFKVVSSLVLCNAYMPYVLASTNAVEVIYDTKHTTSIPLRDMPGKDENGLGIRSFSPSSQEEHGFEVRPFSPPPQEEKGLEIRTFSPPPVTNRKDTSYKLSNLPIKGFQGVGIGLNTYQPTRSPPDTNGAAGLTQYVQWVNPDFGVFDKATGKILDGFPKSGDTLFKGIGGLCGTTQKGDGIIKYDQLANRWVISKFAFNDPNKGPFAQCIAVSATSDAAGVYYQYEFPFPDSLNDYGKLGLGPDAYYLTVNLVGPKSFGPRICALDRTAMLAGKQSSMQCAQLDFLAAAAILPADIDGKSLPPAGTPEYLLGMQGPNTLKLYKFHADFVNPQNATFTGPEIITVNNFALTCAADAGDNCAPQPGTTMKLDTSSDRLMNRLAYRQFPDHGSLLATHTIVNPANKTSMTRWYEIRFNNGSTTPTLYQTGNHPLLNNGWGFTGSIAMDKLGNIAFGYSKSSNTMYPSIGVSARLASAPLGKLSISTTIIKGTGSQANGTRWGDYSGMSIDPVDDCTFWYTNEYRQANAINWSTYIANFKMPGC